MKFSLIHPSRSRPKKSGDTTIEWWCSAENLSDIELIVSLDEDDPQKDEYLKIYAKRDSLVKILIDNNKSSVEAINRAAKFARGEILIVISDDTGSQWHWDKIIGDAVEGKTDFLLRVSDGHQKRICTLPIMDRAYYNRFGYIYHPDYSHNWCDTELTEVAYKLGRIIVRNDIVFRHLHPEVTKEPKDAVYLKNDLTHDSGRKIFQYRKSINFGL